MVQGGAPGSGRKCCTFLSLLYPMWIALRDPVARCAQERSIMARYARETRYPERFSVALSPETVAAVRKEFESGNSGPSTIVQAPVEVGLPILPERNRKRNHAVAGSAK